MSKVSIHNNVGCKYFLSTKGEEAAINSLFRVIDVRPGATDDSREVKIKYLNTDETKWINADKLGEYTKLNPDAYLMYSIVEYDGLKDVLFTIHKVGDNGKVNPAPSMACRQNIVNLFSMMKQENNRIGVSVTTSTLPIGMEMAQILAFDELKESGISLLYKEDTIDDILSVLPTKKLDKVFRDIWNYYDQKGEFKYDSGPLHLYGVANSTEEFFRENDVIHDYHDIFDIIEVPFSLKWKEKVPQKALVSIIAEATHKVPKRCYVYPYSRTIDMSDIQKDYLLMTANPDKAEKDDRDIYIVGYDINHSATYAQFKYGSKENMQKYFEQRTKELGFS